MSIARREIWCGISIASPLYLHYIFPFSCNDKLSRLQLSILSLKHVQYLHIHDPMHIAVANKRKSRTLPCSSNIRSEHVWHARARKDTDNIALLTICRRESHPSLYGGNESTATTSLDSIRSVMARKRPFHRVEMILQRAFGEEGLVSRAQFFCRPFGPSSFVGVSAINILLAPVCHRLLQPY
jgi:hypothetical protein